MHLFQAFGRGPRRLDQGEATLANRRGGEGGGIHTCLLRASHSGLMPGLQTMRQDIALVSWYARFCMTTLDFLE